MASTSIKSSSSSMNFDVFVSFRGEDTRNGFVDHLFAALQRKGIVAFRDDQMIKKGEFIAPELEQAIEGSRVFIVVFSKNYASSTWCLQELAKILHWVKATSQSVLPVFYDVTPSEVRKQTGTFREAFNIHEKRFRNDLEMVRRWREALEAMANRCGWDVHNRKQYNEIEKIVEAVANILGCNQILSFGVALVDMHSRVAQLERLLDLGSNEIVRVIGICGMGGIGKTTVAAALFNKISHQYNAACFIDDVSKLYKDFGPTSLYQALNQQGTSLVRSRLRHSKALIVLDNVDDVEQLEKLDLHPEYLGAGSRIIIISRDSHVLRNYEVNEIYYVQLLDKTEALHLFCRKAFKSDHIVEDYEQMTCQALEYAKGHPLAIKVLGSYLFDRDVSEWSSALATLKEYPKKDIMKVLRISFDGLEEMEKEVFLDIACFFPTCGFDCFVGREFQNYRGTYSEIGKKVLIDKSLLISDEYGNIHMHDLLKELGRSIVREKSPKEPRKWSRLWNINDLLNVTIENKEAKNLEAMIIECVPDEFQKGEKRRVRADVISKMNHLKFLSLMGVTFCSFGGLDNLSNELSYLYWETYPFKMLPSSFHSDKLVELILPRSRIKQLWKGTKDLPSLKKLDLSHSKNLREIPDLTGVGHLEILLLEGCVDIVRIHPSIVSLRELTSLNLKDCKNLVLDLHCIFCLSSLEELNLSGCSKLVYNHMLKTPGQVKHLQQLDTLQFQSNSLVYKTPELPLRFYSSQIHEHSLCTIFPYMSRFQLLSSLDLSFCNLLEVPEAIGRLLGNLERLNLGGNKFVTLPPTIKRLSKLMYLNLQHCKQLKYLPELPSPTTTTGSITNVYLYKEINVFDCPKLRMEHCYGVVFSWMLQIFQEVYLQSSSLRGEVKIVIPGTLIPSWFNNQNVGDSISIDLSPVMEDPNWIGVTCCTVFVAHDDPTNLRTPPRPRYSYYDFNQDDDAGIGSTIRGKNLWGISHLIPILLKKEEVTVDSDHLFILFLTREEFINIVNDVNANDKMEFKTFVPQPQGLHMEVKCCGYRWVFEEDLQHLNPNTMLCNGNSTTQMHKLLTIE